MMELAASSGFTRTSLKRRSDPYARGWRGRLGIMRLIKREIEVTVAGVHPDKSSVSIEWPRQANAAAIDRAYREGRLPSPMDYPSLGTFTLDVETDTINGVPAYMTSDELDGAINGRDVKLMVRWMSRSLREKQIGGDRMRTYGATLVGRGAFPLTREEWELS